MNKKSFAAPLRTRTVSAQVRCSAALALSSVAVAANAVDLPSYSCQMLEHRDGITMTANALNNRGQIVGHQVAPINRTSAVHWNKHGQISTSYSGPNGADWTEAADINDDGVAVGTGTVNYTGPHPRSAAYVWVDGQATLLPGHEEGQTVATGINKSAQVAGQRYTPEGTLATIWSNGQAITLPPLVPGAAAHTVGISDRGDVAGDSDTATPGITHAVRWRDGVAIELDVLRGMEEARATAISASGTVVGISWKPGVTRAVTWIGRKAHALPVPPHTPYAVPKAINRRGEIVGQFDTFEPAYWASADTTGVKINDLLSSRCRAPDGQYVDVDDVDDINDRGVIVATGYWTPRGGVTTGVAFKLVPQVIEAAPR